MSEQQPDEVRTEGGTLQDYRCNPLITLGPYFIWVSRVARGWCYSSSKSVN